MIFISPHALTFISVQTVLWPELTRGTLEYAAIHGTVQVQVLLRLRILFLPCPEKNNPAATEGLGSKVSTSPVEKAIY